MYSALISDAVSSSNINNDISTKKICILIFHIDEFGDVENKSGIFDSWGWNETEKGTLNILLAHDH